MAYEDGEGFKRVKIVDGTGDKNYVKVKQVDDTTVKNYVSVKESDEVAKDYINVMVVGYDSPKDYLNVNFIGAVDDPELLQNSEFNDDSAWITQGASVTFTAENGIGSVVSTSSAEGVRQTTVTEIGTSYTVNYDMQSKTGSVFVRIYTSNESSGFVSLVVEHVTDGLTGSFEFIAESEYSLVYLRNTSSGTTEWDTVSLQAT